MSIHLNINVTLHAFWQPVEHGFVAPKKPQSDESVHFGLVFSNREWVHEVNHDGWRRTIVLFHFNEARSRAESCWL